MRKLILALVVLLAATTCFAAQDVCTVDRKGNIIQGKNFAASTTLISVDWTATPIGTAISDVGSITFTVPFGTTYIGGSDVSGNSIALAATQSALQLDLTNISNMYVTGLAGQKISWFVVLP